MSENTGVHPDAEDPSQNGTWKPTPAPLSAWGDKSGSPHVWFWCEPCGGHAKPCEAQFVEGSDAYRAASLYAMQFLIPDWFNDDPEFLALIAVRTTDHTGAVEIVGIDFAWLMDVAPVEDCDMQFIDMWGERGEGDRG